MFCQCSSSEAVAQRCSVKKVLLETWQNSQENTCVRVSFFTFSYRTPLVVASAGFWPNLKLRLL